MPRYHYKCEDCGTEDFIIKSMSRACEPEKCNCGAIMGKILHIPNVIGTKDNFGIKKAFIDPESGKEITTWKEWEQAGYKPASDTFHKGNKNGRGDKAQTLFKEKLKQKTKHTIQV